MEKGLTNREIAKVIGTTEQVVKNYLRTAFDKLGVWSRLELAIYVASHGGVNWGFGTRPGSWTTGGSVRGNVNRLSLPSGFGHGSDLETVLHRQSQDLRQLTPARRLDSAAGASHVSALGERSTASAGQRT